MARSGAISLALPQGLTFSHENTIKKKKKKKCNVKERTKELFLLAGLLIWPAGLRPSPQHRLKEEGKKEAAGGWDLL